MNEIPQEQLRMAAMDMAIRYLNDHAEDKTHPLILATEFLAFFNGETK